MFLTNHLFGYFLYVNTFVFLSSHHVYLYLKNVQSSEITTNLIRKGLLIISNYLRASANQAIITSNSHRIDVFIVGSNNTSSFQINGLFRVLWDPIKAPNLQCTITNTVECKIRIKIILRERWQQIVGDTPRRRYNN